MLNCIITSVLTYVRLELCPIETVMSVPTCVRLELCPIGIVSCPMSAVVCSLLSVSDWDCVQLGQPAVSDYFSAHLDLSRSVIL